MGLVIRFLLSNFIVRVYVCPTAEKSGADSAYELRVVSFFSLAMDGQLGDSANRQPIAHRVCIRRCERALRAQRPDMFTLRNPWVPRRRYVAGLYGRPLGDVDSVVKGTVELFGNCDNVRITNISVDKLDRLIVHVIHTL